MFQTQSKDSRETANGLETMLQTPPKESFKAISWTRTMVQTQSKDSGETSNGVELCFRLNPKDSWETS